MDISFLETKSRYTLLLSKPSRLMNCQRYDPRGGVKIGAAAGLATTEPSC